MSESEPGPAAGSPDEIRADIEKARTELADTVDALSDKLDVKARAGDKVSDVKAKLTDAAGQAKQAAPEPVQHALDKAGEKAGPVVHQASEQIRPYRRQIAIGAGVAMIGLIVLRNRRNAR